MKVYVPILSNGGGVSPVYMHSFFESLAGDERFVLGRHRRSSHICRARNRASADFLKSGCSSLLFVDGDISFTRRDAEMLLEHNLPIVCGVYNLSQFPPTTSFMPVPGHVPTPAGLIESAMSGTGFMHIQRGVFERMIDAFRDKIEYEAHDRVEWDFFSSGVVDREYLQEDGYFCHRWRSLGGKVFVDPRIQLGHEKPIILPIPVPQSSHAAPSRPRGLRQNPVAGS
jgi:hypothetical protein